MASLQLLLLLLPCLWALPTPMGDFGVLPRSQIAAEEVDDLLSTLRLANAAIQPNVTVPHRPVALTTRGHPGMRGFRATEHIPSGRIWLAADFDDLILSGRPHSQLRRTLQGCEVGGVNYTDLVWSGGAGSKNWLALIFNLLYHKSLGKDSHFYDYLQSLPTKFNTPGEWSSADQEMLKGTSLDSRVLRMDRAVQWLWYQELFPGVLQCDPFWRGKEQFFSLSNFEWASQIVGTRAFGLDYEGTHHKMLCPLLDAANHGITATGEATGAWDFADGKFVMVALTDFWPGDEVTVQYGSMNNAKLLEHYGFTLPYNSLRGQPRTSADWPKTSAMIVDAVKAITGSQEGDEALSESGAASNAVHAARVRMEERDALLGVGNKAVMTGYGSRWISPSSDMEEWVEKKLQEREHFLANELLTDSSQLA